jgi:hypothetical protein
MFLVFPQTVQADIYPEGRHYKKISGLLEIFSTHFNALQ